MKAIKTLVLTAALLPAIGMADANNFTYMEGGYLKGDVGVDVNGWGVRGNVEFIDRVFGSLSYGRLKLDEDIPGFKLSSKETKAGLGYIFGRNEVSNVYGRVNYVDARGSGSFLAQNVKVNDDGFGIDLGTRVNLSPEFELNFELSYTDLGNGNDETLPTVGLLYRFGDSNLAGGAYYSHKSDYKVLMLGLRWFF